MFTLLRLSYYHILKIHPIILILLKVKNNKVKLIKNTFSNQNYLAVLPTKNVNSEPAIGGRDPTCLITNIIKQVTLK